MFSDVQKELNLTIRVNSIPLIDERFSFVFCGERCFMEWCKTRFQVRGASREDTIRQRGRKRHCWGVKEFQSVTRSDICVWCRPPILLSVPRTITGPFSPIICNQVLFLVRHVSWVLWEVPPLPLYYDTGATPVQGYVTNIYKIKDPQFLEVHHSLFALATIRLSTLLIRATLAFAIANGSPFVSVTKNMPIAMEGLLIDVHCHDLKKSVVCC